MTWYRDAFCVGTFFVPLAWIVITLLVRHATRAGQSSGSDLLSAVIAFDVAVLLAPEEFVKLAVDAKATEGLIPFHVFTLFAAIMLWATALIVVEPRLSQNTRVASSGSYGASPTPYLLGVAFWTICWGIALLHVLLFRGKLS